MKLSDLLGVLRVTASFLRLMTLGSKYVYLNRMHELLSKAVKRI